eukprot:TRINITY_DN16294_c1_g1_i1.p1 TRINITY_DN16294_c1_g1~~TRINITY_DN16294_c1_g1_i1.p1  ORF type:complete len:333 (+),score=44.87 TRINITY_DN16294_c1_g1_i1:168-1166(+)
MGGFQSQEQYTGPALPTQEVVSLSSSGAHGRPQMPAASVQRCETGQVKIQLVWDKHSFELHKGNARHLWELSAKFTAEVPCELFAFFHCKEMWQGEETYLGKKEASTRAGKPDDILQYIELDQAGPPAFQQKFDAGTHTIRLDDVRSINLHRWPLEAFWKYSSRRGSELPIVFALRAPGVQSVVHLSLVVKASQPEAHLLCQKVVFQGQRYTLQEVYGLADLKEDEGNAETHGELCVICLSDPRTTAVLPCRHLCCCEECARVLSYGSQTRGDQCPICRSKITGVQVFKVKPLPSDNSSTQPSASNSPAAEPAASTESTAVDEGLSRRRAQA